MSKNSISGGRIWILPFAESIRELHALFPLGSMRPWCYQMHKSVEAEQALLFVTARSLGLKKGRDGGRDGRMEERESRREGER